MIYDVIIIGAGASGLFAAASFEKPVNGLILNSSRSPGIKLLLSGSGQCNLTKSGDIKDFLSHYGLKGPKIRKALYKFSNQALVDYLAKNGMVTVEREDGKVFPKSLKSRDVLDLLLSRSQGNGFVIKNSQQVRDILSDQGFYTLITEDGSRYQCRNLLVATGGSSYPATGSNGSILPALSALQLKIVPAKPALVPVFVEAYGFTSLSGISFPTASVTIDGHTNWGGLLLTHNNFSGPAVLDASRYADPGLELKINYFPGIDPSDFLHDLKAQIPGNQKQISTVISEFLGKHGENNPKRFVDMICQLSSVDPAVKASTVSGKQLAALVNRLTGDTYKISGTAGYNQAMSTAGGVSLDEIDLNTFESKKYPGLYVTGEALDVDGDTGGYNIQFAFSSGYLAAKSIASKLV